MNKKTAPRLLQCMRLPPLAFKLAVVIIVTPLCLSSKNAEALPSDRDQPIQITADKALRDEVQGITVYSGNVQLVQGTMELDSDKLTIYHTTDTADKIIAEGRPAKMRQQPELDKAIVHAHGRTITYYKNEDRVHLQTDARIEQEGAVVEGDAIDYFIAKQVITAESDKSNENERVVVVIPPSVREGVENDNEPPKDAAPENTANDDAFDTMSPEAATLATAQTGAEAAAREPGVTAGANNQSEDRNNGATQGQ